MIERRSSFVFQEWNAEQNNRVQQLSDLRQTNRALVDKVTAAETRISSVEFAVKRYQPRERQGGADEEIADRVAAPNAGLRELVAVESGS